MVALLAAGGSTIRGREQITKSTWRGGKSKSKSFAHTFAITDRAFKIELSSGGRLCVKSSVCGPARAESPASLQPRATPWVPCPHTLRPVRAKVWANDLLLLLPPREVDFVIYSRPRIALPSAASSATAGRESCYRRPRIDDFL